MSLHAADFNVTLHTDAPSGRAVDRHFLEPRSSVLQKNKKELECVAKPNVMAARGVHRNLQCYSSLFVDQSTPAYVTIFTEILQFATPFSD